MIDTVDKPLTQTGKELPTTSPVDDVDREARKAAKLKGSRKERLKIGKKDSRSSKQHATPARRHHVSAPGLKVEFPINTATREQVSQLTMLASIRGGPFEDVKFYAFSRRTRAGDVDTPLPLFGNSALIRKASTHFDFVLTQGFAESGITDMDAAFPSSRPSHVDLDEYCYASDSDLEDEAEDKRGSLRQEVQSSMAKPPSSPSVRTLGDHGEGGEVPPETSDEVVTKKEKGTMDPLVRNTTARPGRMGHIVFLDDIAYRTWKAFIFYAYFDQVSFTPLRSQEQADVAPTGPFDLPTCSPKSMYRLAEKYGIESLKEKAAHDIKSKLTTENILAELFSSFTLTHLGIQKMEVDFLFEHISDPALVSRLPKWFQYLENGELHAGAGAVLSTLMNRLILGISKK